MFLKTVNERGGELLIHSGLLSNKNEPNDEWNNIILKNVMGISSCIYKVFIRNNNMLGYVQCMY